MEASIPREQPRRMEVDGMAGLFLKLRHNTYRIA